MAGIFGLFDYTKEGKGVYPDDPPRGPIPTFFGILGRKFWKICTVNIMYIIFSLPIFALAAFASMYLTGILFPGLNIENLAKIIEQAGMPLKEGITPEIYAATQLAMALFVFAMVLVGLSLVIAGPTHAGVTYVLRNYSREEHAFVWSDFKEHALKNFKQSLICSLISMAVTVILAINYAFYNSQDGINDILRVILKTIIVIIAIFWCIIQMYLYPMMVTFQLKIKQLYKNALLFSILRMPLNVLIMILSLVILAVLPAVLLLLGYGASILGAVIWYLFLAFGLNLLMTNFFVYRALDKYMIQKIKAAESLNDEETESSEAVEEQPEDDGQDSGEPQKENKGLSESPSQAGNS
jgi:uncharacterized membrane protein YesL